MASDKRTFVQLADTYDPKKHQLDTKMVSIKLDGMRFLWDGGVSRGLLATEVPYANTEKDYRRLAAARATGLWSRYGKVIHAPDFFLDQLPVGQMLDGELYTGRNQLQIILGTTKSFTPDVAKWKRVNAYVIDAPTYAQFCRPGRIYETHHKYSFSGTEIDWINRRLSEIEGKPSISGGQTFEDTYRELLRQSWWGDQLHLLEQHDISRWQELYDKEIDLGGEGVVFRDRYVGWTPKRHSAVLKHKPDYDSEGVILGWKSGRLTDLDSRWLGMMGAVLVRWSGDGKSTKGGDFWMSGFNEHERLLTPPAAKWATEHPDQMAPDDMNMMFFSIGDRIQFKYGELTNDGLPRRAVYSRKRPPGDD